MSLMNTEKDDLRRNPFENAFPKTCKVCGEVYPNHDSFMAKTEALSAGSLSQGPHESVLSYRNCKCGSTITIKVEDMRDYSEAGIKQREEFKRRLKIHEDNGVEIKDAIALVKKEMGLE